MVMVLLVPTFLLSNEPAIPDVTNVMESLFSTPTNDAFDALRFVVADREPL